jgi:hypothetical protein
MGSQEHVFALFFPSFRELEFNFPTRSVFFIDCFLSQPMPDMTGGEFFGKTLKTGHFAFPFCSFPYRQERLYQTSKPVSNKFDLHGFQV